MELGVGRRLSYRTARRLLIVTGLVVLGATAAVLYVRRVEDVEVIAVLLFVPIYLAVVLGKVWGGAIAAVAASVVYAVLRLSGVDAFDTSQQWQLIASRSIAYLTFGLVGGFAVRELENALMKLDRYDLVDDDTGLFNSRFMAHELELELARAKRYGSSFGVVLLEVPIKPVLALRRNRRAEALRALGETVSDAIRLVDRAAVALDGDHIQVSVLMPETPREGGEVVASRLAPTLAGALEAAGAGMSSALDTRLLVFPGDDDALGSLRDQYVEFDRAEHPENPEVALP